MFLAAAQADEESCAVSLVQLKGGKLTGSKDFDVLKAASGRSIKLTKRAPRTASGGSKDVSLAAAPMKDPQPLTDAEFEALQYRLDGLTDTDKIDDLLDIVGETEAVTNGTGTAEVNLDLQALPAGKQRAIFDFIEQAQKEDQAAASAAAADVDFAANDGLRRLAADAAASEAAASDDLLGMEQPTEFSGRDPGAGDWQQQVFTAAVHAAHDVGR